MTRDEPEDRGKTHYDGCWRHHLKCARATMEDIGQRFPELIAARDAEIRREEREACATIAEGYGCGKPGCGECYAGAVANAIRARTPATPTAVNRPLWTSTKPEGLAEPSRHYDGPDEEG